MDDEACALRVILQLNVLILAGPRDSGARQCAWRGLETDDVDMGVERFYQVK
jgi:hypothetical protein